MGDTKTSAAVLPNVRVISIAAAITTMIRLFILPPMIYFTISQNKLIVNEKNRAALPRPAKSGFTPARLRRGPVGAPQLLPPGAGLAEAAAPSDDLT